MSERVLDRLLAGETVELSALRTAIARAIFGDRVGLTLALGALVWVGGYWQLGFFSNDQYTFANAVVALVEGHLAITTPVYGPPSGATPGAVLSEGQVYGRNYAVVAVSAVWLLVLRLVALVADPRLVLVGLWSLATAGVGSGIGAWAGRERTGARVGAAVGAALFVGNVAVATPLAPRWLPLVALQLTTALAAAFVAVLLYRLGSRLASRRVGVAMGAVAVVGTPVGFWAALPKRHSVTAVLVVATMYALYRSRVASTPRTATRFRALAYCLVGPAAWLHAAEGFVLLVALAAVDLPTARSNRPRDLLVVGAAMSVSLLPFFATNWLIAGNPLIPPRLLPAYTGDVLSSGAGQAAGAGESAAAGSGATPAGGTGSGGSAGGTLALLGSILGRVASLFGRAYGQLVTDPGRTATIVLRTGYVGTLPADQDAAINLSVLASMPLLGGLVAVPLLGRVVDVPAALRSPGAWRPVRVLDAFTVVYALALCGVFLGPLPTHHMYTVRYLHPLYPIGLYWLVRVPAVRRVCETRLRTAATSAAATAAVGSLAYLGAIAALGLVLGEAVQLYALSALVVAAAVGCWALVATRRGGCERVGALVLGAGAGAMAAYLLVGGLALFPVSGEFTLPLSRVLSDAVHYARLYGSAPPY